MKVTPRTEKELAEQALFEPGLYDFEVMKAEDTISKSSGAEMIKLKLRIFLESGERHLYDYLLDSMAFKIKHFAEAVGLTERYEAGELTADDCVGRAGKVLVKVDRDKHGVYPDRNAVKDYWVETATSRETARTDGKVKLLPQATDDIPF